MSDYVIEEGGGLYAVGPRIRDRVAVPIDEVSRSSRAIRLFSAILIACAFLAMPVALRLRTDSIAADPFLFLYVAVSVVAIGVASDRQQGALMHAVLVAHLFVPATLSHLALTALRTRNVVQRAPSIARLPYLVALALVPVGAIALYSSQILWLPFLYLVLAASAITILLLLASAWYAIRESTAPLERARARLLFYGGMLLPALPSAALVRSEPDVPEILTAYLWSSVAFMPLPIGLAISRYNLFNIEWDARRLVARLVYILAIGMTVTALALVSQAGFGLPEIGRNPALLFAVTVGCAMFAEPVRARLLPFLEARLSPQLEEFRERRERLTRELSQQEQDDDVARLVGQAIAETLGAESCAVILDGERPRFAYARGDLTAVSIERFKDAFDQLGSRSVSHLPLHPDDRSASRLRLEAAGVEAIVEFGTRAQLGLVLIGPRGRGGPYAGAELDFAAVLASHASGRVRELRETEARIATEQRAAAGRVAIALVHDLGKEVAWLRRLAERLPERVNDIERFSRDLRMIQEFADNVTATIETVGLQASGGRAPHDPPLDYVLDSAIAGVERVRRSAIISKTVEPEIRGLQTSLDVGRIVRNLLDNAVGASDGAGVHLFATQEYGSLKVVVSDSGIGMEPAVLSRAFEAGFTTKGGSGGLGIGLSVSRDLALGMGGSIAIAPGPSSGTVATLTVPIVDDRVGHTGA